MNPARKGNGVSFGTILGPVGTRIVSQGTFSPSIISTNYFRMDDFLIFAGKEMREVKLDATGLGKKALQAKTKLKRAIDETMKGPVSKHALKLVDAFGNPLEEELAYSTVTDLARCAVCRRPTHAGGQNGRRTTARAIGEESAERPRGHRADGKRYQPLHRGFQYSRGQWPKRALAGLDLLHVGNRLGGQIVALDHKNGWTLRADQGNGPVLKLGRRIAFGMSVGNFLQFQSAFQSNRVQALPTEKEQMLGLGILERQLPDLFALLQNPGHQVRQTVECLHDRLTIHRR